MSDLTIGKSRADQARKNGSKGKKFDWEKALDFILKNKDKIDSVEAGLLDDWCYTGGVIFENGKATNDDYKYLGSLWATPAMKVYYKDGDFEEIDCYVEGMDFDVDWTDDALSKINGEVDNVTQSNPM